MKIYNSIILLIIITLSCKEKTNSSLENSIPKRDTSTYTNYGQKIIADDAIEGKSMAYHYKTMTIGDSIPSKMTGKVTQVSNTKAPWITINIGAKKEVMVTFKNNAFSTPMDIKGKDVIVNGNAYIKVVPVNEQKAQNKETAITEITNPKRTYAFEANAVLIKQ